MYLPLELFLSISLCYLNYLLCYYIVMYFDVVQHANVDPILAAIYEH